MIKLWCPVVKAATQPARRRLVAYLTPPAISVEHFERVNTLNLRHFKARPLKWFSDPARGFEKASLGAKHPTLETILSLKWLTTGFACDLHIALAGNRTLIRSLG